MPASITNTGERGLLVAAVVGIGDLYVKLAKAAFTLSEDPIGTDFTEADYPGYAAQLLVFDVLEAGNPGGKAVADFVALTFTCTSNLTPQDIYGYWIEDDLGNVVGMEIFTGNPRPMRTNGDNVILRIKLRLFSPL